MEDRHNFGPHYDRTLTAWHTNATAQWDDLPDGDERVSFLRSQCARSSRVARLTDCGGKTKIEVAPCAPRIGCDAKGVVMATLTRPEERTSTRPQEPIDLYVDEHRPGNRFFIITIAVLALALIGLGAWTFIDRSSSSDTAVTGDIQQLLDENIAAWNDYDGEAFSALVTENYYFVMGPDRSDAAEMADFIPTLESSNWHVEQTGDAIMVGDGPWLVAVPNLLTGDDYGVDGQEGFSLMTVVDVDGTLLIARHEYMRSTTF